MIQSIGIAALATVVAAAALAPALSGQSAVSTSVSIQGVAIDSATKKPIAGAIVTAIRNGPPPLSQNATSSSTGAFQFSGLPAATYRLCVQVLAGGYLNPCSWSPNPPTVTLTNGKPVTVVQLKIAPGSVLRIRIDDPTSLLGQIGKSGQAPPISMGVRTATGFIEPLVMRSADITGSAHEITIPFDAAVPVWLHSAKLTLTQSGGSAVPAAGLVLPVTHPSAAAVAPPQLAFQIVGLKP